MKRLTPTNISYTQLLAEQKAILTALVHDCYFRGPVQLQQIAEHTFEDRGIHRVLFEDGRSYVLRAFCFDVREDLLSQATLLTYLQQQGYPAPHVLHTLLGTPVAFYENWMGLMISYADGVLADFSQGQLTLLGAQMGRLHKQSEHILENALRFTLPYSRLHPQQIQLLADHATEVGQLPEVLRELYEASVATIEVLQRAVQLPITLLYGDCWPHNAVVEGGQITLIDWDCAGLGPAVLDVGYLLLTCHLGKPQLPAMHANSLLIEAVMRGYYQQRRLTQSELAVLREAVHFEVARRVVAEYMLTDSADRWQNDVQIQKGLARFAVSDEIARIALELVG